MCDSVVAVASETTAGVTLYGKNSDRKAGECQPFVQVTEAYHPPHARLRCTHIEIPQVAETYRAMGHSPWWVWGFEQGVNEHAVAIGNHTVFSNEVLEETPGLIGMDLVRLGLERGRTAREALEVIATLIESHGQGGAAIAHGGDAVGYHNGFVLADPTEAWILETSNRRWAARRLRLDGFSNHLSLGTDWEIGSRDLESFARSLGWWRGAGRVNVGEAYRNPNVPPQISEGRYRRSNEMLVAHRGRHDLESFQAILRDHQGGEAWQPGATPEEEGFFTLCAHSEPVQWTAGSLIAPLPRERAGAWPVWISFATPCTGVFLPVYLDGVIPSALARGDATPGADSAWWTFKRLQDATAGDPPRHTRILREGWADFEEKIEAERSEIETSARRATLSGDPDRGSQILSDFMARTVEAARKRAETLRARIL